MDGEHPIITMPYYPEYKTNWVDELPQGTCPACKSTEVEDNSFTDKKGNQWESVKCEGCRTKWIKSKGFKDKPTTIRKETPTDLQLLMDLMTTIDKGQREIWKLLDIMNKKIDELKR